MATVTRSAADSAAKLFGSITVTADAVTTLVGAAGSAFGVLDIKAKSWLKSTREETVDAETVRSATTGSAAARLLVDHFEELDTYISAGTKRKAAYESALEAIMVARQKAAA